MALIPLYGGKWRMTGRLLPLITEHDAYVEHFCGGAALFFSKAPSKIEVLNDVDGELINFFRVLRDPEKFERWLRAVACTPFSREETELARDLKGDDVERARKFYTLAMQSFASDMWDWGYGATGSNNAMPRRWFNRLPKLPAFHARLMNVQIECSDFRRSLCLYDDPWTFHYLDPPYLHETRRVDHGYRFEMSRADHTAMLDLALQLCGKVMISGYRSDLYEERLASWKRFDYETYCFAASKSRGVVNKKREPRTESVWLNVRAQRG